MPVANRSNFNSRLAGADVHAAYADTMGRFPVQTSRRRHFVAGATLWLVPRPDTVTALRSEASQSPPAG
jgi:hypothetical protein